jgi:hypothetical protein
VSTISAIIIGAAGSLLALFISQQFEFGRALLQKFFRMPFRVASALVEGGITRMTLSRADYHRYRSGAGVLRDYLALAQQSIDIVSISLNVTQAEGSLISLFEERIQSNPVFRVRVTLLNPHCGAVPHLAKSLDLSAESLRGEIIDTLTQLNECRQRLGNVAQERLQIFVHDTLPIGSAILLDATPASGRIQVETKLYRAPRTESFGFEVIGPSSFYSRNFIAWQKVFGDSQSWVSQSAIAQAPLNLLVHQSNKEPCPVPLPLAGSDG